MKNLQPWLRFGIIYALIAIAMSLFTTHVYYFGMTLQTVISFGLLFVFFYFTIKTYKSQNEGYLPYGETFKYCFLMGIVGFVIVTIYNFIYYNYINPEAAKILVQKIIEGTESGYRSIGMSEDKIMEVLEKVEKTYDDYFSLSTSVLNFVGIIFINLIFAAITAIFLKKENKG
jgi:hypothetical protein